MAEQQIYIKKIFNQKSGYDCSYIHENISTAYKVTCTETGLHEY